MLKISQVETWMLITEIAGKEISRQEFTSSSYATDAYILLKYSPNHGSEEYFLIPEKK